MRKVFVLDSSVLLLDPEAMLRFEQGDVVIPVSTIDEIADPRRGSGFRSAAAIDALDRIEKWRSEGSLLHGVPLPSGGVLRMVSGPLDKASFSAMKLSGEGVGDRLLATARLIREAEKREVVVVSRDPAVLAKASGLGIEGEKFGDDEAVLAALEGPPAERFVSSDAVDQLYAHGEVRIEGYHYPNQPIVLVDSSNPSHRGLGLYRADRGAVERLPQDSRLVSRRQSPLNMEQRFLLAMLLDPSIGYLTATGMTGSGKTLLSLAAALRMVIDHDPRYSKLIVVRPYVTAGRDPGTLPGTLDEKNRPLFGPILGHLETLLESPNSSENGDGRNGGGRNDERFNGARQQRQKRAGRDSWTRPEASSIELLQAMGKLELVTPAFLQGSSLKGSIVIVDEAQNVSTADMKLIMTRIEADSKLVLTGDWTQIINVEECSRSINGLVRAATIQLSQPYGGHVALQKCLRHEGAAVAARLM